MTEDKQQRAGLIRPVELVAWGLAAVVAALLGSKLGVAGTVLGAGLASVVSTLGAAVFQHWLERTGRSVRKAVAHVPVKTRVLRRARGGRAQQGTGGNASDVPTVPFRRPVPPPSGNATGQRTVWLRPGERPTVVHRQPTPPAQAQPPPPARWRRWLRGFRWRDVRWRELRWKGIVATIAVMAAIGIGTVTVIEAGLGESVWGGKPSTATALTGGAVQDRAPAQPAGESPGEGPGRPGVPEHGVPSTSTAPTTDGEQPVPAPDSRQHATTPSEERQRHSSSTQPPSTQSPTTTTQPEPTTPAPTTP